MFPSFLSASIHEYRNHEIDDRTPNETSAEKRKKKEREKGAGGDRSEREGWKDKKRGRMVCHEND